MKSHSTGDFPLPESSAPPLDDRRVADSRASVPRRRAARRRSDGGSIDEVLSQIILLIEQQMPAMSGSILLLDEDGRTLHDGAGPHLPGEYRASIDGSLIGPCAGSCGTAAYRREQVIVRDIASDPLWADYKHLALVHDLRACWSTPFMDDAGNVLGTFAMYYTEPREPTAEELSLIKTAALLAANIVLRHRTTLALAESEARTRNARAEAEHANKVKSDFLAMMSHELRTPLNAIGGYAMLMLDDIPDPATASQQLFLDRIVKAQKHLLGLVDALLTHAKLEAGRMTYHMDNLALGELLDSVHELVAPQMATKAIAYGSEQCDRELVLRCDREKVMQILLNLLSNASKFTPVGGSVALRTQVPTPGKVIIGVRDTGIGMSAAEIASLFEPFVQVDNALTRMEKGTGLGVPISRELARGMGGDLLVESEPGQGTEFLLLLSTDPTVRHDSTIEHSD